MEPKKLSVRSRKHSFAYAITGLRLLFREEPNAKLHALATLIAVAAGFVRHISQMQWLALVIVIGLVWITEALNTCIERLCDYACEGKTDPLIKVIKDISAGAVLIAAIVSVVTAFIIFVL
jgi:diacylglycerol kinase